jgi:hypothetical protein
MKKAILYGVLVWFLLIGTVHAQVYEPNDDNKPVFVGTRGGVSVWTEPHGVAFFVDFSGATVAYGRKAAGGGVSGSPVYENIAKIPTIRLGTGTSEYAYWILPTSPVGGSMFAESLGGELVTNGDFETIAGASNFGSWTEAPNSGQIWDTGVTVHGGSHAAVMVMGTGSGPELTQGVQCTSGQTYKVQGWTADNGIQPGGLKIYNSTAGYYINTAFPETNKTTYRQVSYFFTARVTGTHTIYLFKSTPSGTTAYFDDWSIKEVNNEYENLPPHGTAVCWFRPGYNASDMTGGVSPAVLDLSGDTLFQVYASGVTCTDGTTGATVAYTPVADKMVKLVAKWGYLSSNIAKMRVGIDTGNGLTWGIEQNFDGAFSVGNQLRVLTSPWGRAHVAQLAIFSRIVDTGEINMWGSP